MTQTTNRPTWILFAAASAVLAWHPVEWLVTTWTDPSYGSSGYVYAAAVLLLAARSLSSGPAAGGGGRVLGPLLLAAVGLRFLAQVLAVNILGGAALAVDVAGLGYLLRLERRPRAVSPLWLAALFLFALPVGNALERVAGFPLQLVSARVSCAMLAATHEAVTCEGVRIGIDGRDVMVDLPCAGASGLLLMLALWMGMNACLRPRPRDAALSGAAVLVLALIGNAVRIALLAGGLARDLPVMAEPWHSAIGLATLALSALPLLFLYQPRSAAQPPARPARRVPLPLAAGCLCLALWIVAQPARPLDVSRPLAPRPLPASLDGEPGVPGSLSPLERLYFTSYGGVAVKSQYGPLGLNRVTTTSPLRHLHSPEDCLRGLGFRTEFLGSTYAPVPSSVYRATGPDGRVWRVAVSFVSDRGEVVPSVGEAIWHWLRKGGTWSSLQRITPEVLPEPARKRLEGAALAALDIPANP